MAADGGKVEEETKPKQEDKVTNGVKAAEDSQKKVTKQSASPQIPDELQPAMVFVGCFAVALVVSIVSHSQVLEGGSLVKWGNSLFAEHVVPPPRAPSSVCTIQFCQS